MVKFTVKTLSLGLERRRLDAGVALGPILFILAILALFATIFSAGSGSFNEASIVDRISSDVPSQANMIINLIGQCHQQYLANQTLLAPGYTVPTPAPEPYPDTYPSTAGSAIDVKNLLCNATGGSTSPPGLWTTGNVEPTPTVGFGDWYYIDASASGGGRCIWTQPTVVNSNIATGLTNAAKQFTHNTANDGISIVNYDKTKSGLRFVAWISMPTGTANANCKPQ